MNNHNNQRGFTLIELIMVIVIMGVIAGMVTVFMKSPIDAYFASARRAALTDVADTVVRRMARDLHKALPNSIRPTGSGQCIEFIPTKTGGRYRAEGSGALDFAGTATTASFNSLGSNTSFVGVTTPTDQQIASGDVIVVYNLGIPGSDAYELSNTAVSGAPSAAASSPAETAIGITYSPGLTHFPLASGSNRFHVIPGDEKIVAYSCRSDGSQINLYRNANYAFTKDFSCPTSGGSLLAKNATCTFTYDSSNQRNALVQISIILTDNSGESVNLYHEVHVDNTP